MKLSSEVCSNAARAVDLGSLWEEIGAGATVRVHKDRVEVALVDGRKFSVARKSHEDYSVHVKGDFSHHTKKHICELGKEFIQIVRKDDRETVKDREAVSKEIHRIADKVHSSAEHVRKKHA